MKVVEDFKLVDVEVEAIKGEEKEIKCRSCDKKLGTLFITIEPDLNFENAKSMQWICPCNEKSFIVKSKFKSFFIPEEQLLYSKFSQENKVFVTYLKQK